jgi:hypothetical protein
MWQTVGWLQLLRTAKLVLEGSTSQATYIYISVPSSSHFSSGFGIVCTLLMARWMNHASLCYCVAGLPPALLCNIVNTSYADPPKLHKRWALNREIQCGAVLLSPSSRAKAVS